MVVCQSLFSRFKGIFVFLPDQFSNPNVQFTLCSRDKFAEIKNIILCFYYDLGGLGEKILQSGSLEINSNNFLLKIGGKEYILKRILSCGDDISRKRSQAVLVNWLVEKEIKIPLIVKSIKNGELIVENQGAVWCLSEFVDGEYFSGKGNELLDAGQNFIHLFGLLKNYNVANEFFVSNVIVTPYGIPENLFSKILEGKRNWVKLLGRKNADLLETSWDILVHDVGDIDAAYDYLVSNRGLCHIDLHPHNILVKNHKIVSILDFESFVYAPIESAVYFNIFKLARQTVVAGGGSSNIKTVKDVVRLMLDELRKNKIVNSIESGHVILMTKVEVFRRIIYILDNCFVKKNSTWNHVLPIQISALKEIEALYTNI